MGRHWCQLRVSCGGNKGCTLGVVSLRLQTKFRWLRHVGSQVHGPGLRAAQVGIATASSGGLVVTVLCFLTKSQCVQCPHLPGPISDLTSLEGRHWFQNRHGSHSNQEDVNLLVAWHDS